VAGAPIAAVVVYIVTRIIPDHVATWTLHPSARNPHPIAPAPTIVSTHPHWIRIRDWSDRSSLVASGGIIAFNQKLPRFVDRRCWIERIEERLSDRIRWKDAAVLVHNTSGETQSGQNCEKHFAHSLTSFLKKSLNASCSQLALIAKPEDECLTLRCPQGCPRLQMQKSAIMLYV